MRKKLLLMGAVAVGLLGGFGGVSASAKAHINYYHNIKDAGYGVGYRNVVAYTSANLAHRRGHLKQWQDVRATYSASVTKSNGKRAVYYRIKTKSGKVGWVWRGWLIRIEKGPTVTTTIGSGSSDDSNNSSTDNSSTEPTGQNVTSTQTVNHFSNAEYRQTFFTELNKERTKRGIAPLTQDAQLNQLADVRAPELVSNFSHYDASGNALFDMHAKEMGITTAFAENIAYSMNYQGGAAGSDEMTDGETSADFAKDNLHEFIYYDAASNWGHRDALLNPKYTIIGISSVYVVGKNGAAKQYAVNNLGFSE